MTKQDLYCYFVGTAGAGKSTLTYAFDLYLKKRGLDTVLVNLDPGAEELPYVPDVDIRQYVSLREVMEEHGLGPNGAQVAAADMIALNLDEVKDELSAYRSEYVLIDTPGQIELFLFRESGRAIVQGLNPERSLIAYLLDPYLARTPSGFVSQLMLAATALFRFDVPITSVLTKADALSMEDLEALDQWIEDPESLHDRLLSESPTMQKEFSRELLPVLIEVGGLPFMVKTSAAAFEGMEDLYASIHQSFMGGEDLLSD